MTSLMRVRVAVIGSLGQDGYYLSCYLMAMGARVFGVSRRFATHCDKNFIDDISVSDRWLRELSEWNPVFIFFVLVIVPIRKRFRFLSISLIMAGRYTDLLIFLETVKMR